MKIVNPLLSRRVNKALKPRNPVLEALKNRGGGAGAHGPSRGAIRRAEKMSLLDELREMQEEAKENAGKQPGVFLFCTRATEATCAALAFVEFFDHIHCNLQYRNHDELRDALHGLQGKSGLRAIPQRDHDLSLVIGIDQADKIAEHDAVFMTQSRTRKDDCGQSRVCQMN